MMEQTKSRKGHYHIIFITCLNHIVISYRTTRLSYIFYTASMCAFNIVAKWEECV